MTGAISYLFDPLHEPIPLGFSLFAERPEQRIHAYKERVGPAELWACYQPEPGCMDYMLVRLTMSAFGLFLHSKPCNGS